ncbi:hypothetical protein BDV93DRAFT_545764 [Ceratobasidium sp. AG-I]|nr:hypothetical protein BDV93DRAFT_545764 [Ceratobasidium sp. AG-I]
MRNRPYGYNENVELSAFNFTADCGNCNWYQEKEILQSTQLSPIGTEHKDAVEQTSFPTTIPHSRGLNPWTNSSQMPKEIKSRNRIASGGPSSSRGTRLTESEDVKSLRNLLKQCNANAVVKTITDSLRTASPEDLGALKTILDPLFKASLIPLHYVRCHTTYVESSNHDNACVIECDEDPAWHHEFNSHNGKDGYYKTPCCRREFYEGDEPDYCFKTSHTTDPKSVSYREGEEEDEEDGLDLGGEKNVVTCRVHGCEPARQ